MPRQRQPWEIRDAQRTATGYHVVDADGRTLTVVADGATLRCSCSPRGRAGRCTHARQLWPRYEEELAILAYREQHPLRPGESCPCSFTITFPDDEHDPDCRYAPAARRVRP